MIKHALNGDEYLNICKHYRHIYNTASIQADELKWKEALQNAVIFVILAPFDHEQSDLIHRINADANLAKIPLFKYAPCCSNLLLGNF